jgi:hypothetical protein
MATPMGTITKIEVMGHSPKTIEEFIGRANSRTETVLTLWKSLTQIKTIEPPHF